MAKKKKKAKKVSKKVAKKSKVKVRAKAPTKSRKQIVAKSKKTKVSKKPAPAPAPKAPVAAPAAALAASGGGSTPGVSAPGAKPESAALKNFRHHPDIENFYRFIHENDLRFEALKLMDQMILQKQAKKLIKASKAKAH